MGAFVRKGRPLEALTCAERHVRGRHSARHVGAEMEATQARRHVAEEEWALLACAGAGI